MEKLMEAIINFLLKKKIIKLSYIENSFFLYKKLDKKIKLTQEIITLNYSSESPYLLKNSVISSIIENENLYLWFTKGSKSRYLPEAHLIFRRLQESHDNLIFIIDGAPNKVIIIKNGNMIASFSKVNISIMDKKLMENEYQIDTIIELTEEEYTGYIENSLKFLTINDLLNILNIKIDMKELFSKTIYFLALPLLITSIILTLLLAGYSFYLDTQKELLDKEFKDRQRSNKEVKETIFDNDKENIIYQELRREFRYVDKTIALSKILKITDDMNMTMYYIKIYDKNIDFIIKTTNSSKIPFYIKKLFETNQFEDVKNLNTRKMRKSITEVTMSAKLKEVD